MTTTTEPTELKVHKSVATFTKKRWPPPPEFVRLAAEQPHLYPIATHLSAKSLETGTCGVQLQYKDKSTQNKQTNKKKKSNEKTTAKDHL